MTNARTSPREHASPHRDRVRLEWLIGALMAGPTGWILQLVINYGWSSHACRPGDSPRSAPPESGWGGEHLGLLIVNVACLALILSGGAVAFDAWRRSRREKPGVATALLDVGEGRTRFLAAGGMLSAATFTIATLFDTAWPLFIASCWRFT